MLNKHPPYHGLVRLPHHPNVTVVCNVRLKIMVGLLDHVCQEQRPRVVRREKMKVKRRKGRLEG